MNEDDPFKDNADLIRAMEDAPPRGDIPLPERALFALERARREALAAQKDAAPAENVIRPAFSRFSPMLLRLAAVFVLLGALAWIFIPRHPGTARVVVSSPGDTIGDTRPVIAWNSRDKPGQKYDVWILPAEGDHLTARTLFKAENVTSPVQFAALKPGKENSDSELRPGGQYRVLVCLAGAGRMAGVPVPFAVSPPPAPK